MIIRFVSGILSNILTHPQNNLKIPTLFGCFAPAPSRRLGNNQQIAKSPFLGGWGNIFCFAKNYLSIQCFYNTNSQSYPYTYYKIAALFGYKPARLPPLLAKLSRRSWLMGVMCGVAKVTAKVFTKVNLGL